MSTWSERDESSIWHPFTPLVGLDPALAVTKGEGVYLHTEDGQQIIDAISSWWVNLHGHSHPKIAEAIAEQARTLEHVIFAGFTHPPAVALAERLLGHLPDNQSRIFYSDNGSTAVEVALKMAMQFWYNQGKEKPTIVALDGSYHGDTFGSMSVGDRSPFSAPFDRYLFDVEFLEFPSREKEEAVLERFTQLCQSGRVGAFIFEPLIQGASGMRMYRAKLLDALIEVAHAHEVICIADEVMTGFARTGRFFASDYLTHKPDIFCLSKGLTGGALPMGVTSCTEAIMDAYRSEDLLKTFFHGHSFTANPMACAAALASMDLLEEEACTQQRNQIAASHSLFMDRLQDHPKVENLRTSGTIVAFDYVDKRGDTNYFNEARHRLYPFFIKQGVLLRPLGNVVYVLPPYCITPEQLDVVYNAIDKALEKI
ncbi:MAG TPA: adenosylmethionine--8-amino-7-oxononanoate transaminase [Cytophagales bacterium]|nr:adenosylmethionine--8-amino-7-oxononanoate transaminase [Cytophagales bacterium]